MNKFIAPPPPSEYMPKFVKYYEDFLAGRYRGGLVEKPTDSKNYPKCTFTFPDGTVHHGPLPTGLHPPLWYRPGYGPWGKSKRRRL
jgi:hypothetical protein